MSFSKISRNARDIKKFLCTISIAQTGQNIYKYCANKYLLDYAYSILFRYINNNKKVSQRKLD